MHRVCLTALSCSLSTVAEGLFADVYRTENRRTATAAKLSMTVAIPATWILRARLGLNGMRSYSSQMRSPQSHSNIRMASSVSGKKTALINFSLPPATVAISLRIGLEMSELFRSEQFHFRLQAYGCGHG